MRLFICAAAALFATGALANDPVSCLKTALSPTGLSMQYNDAMRLCAGATDLATACMQKAVDPAGLSLVYKDAVNLCAGASTYDPAACIKNAMSQTQGQLQLIYSDALNLCSSH